MDANVIISGLVAGSLYALVAVGFNILYRATKIFNMAQGDFVMLGALVGAVALGSFGLSWPVATIVTLGFVGVIALLEERIAIRPIVARSGSSWVISTLAFSMIIQNIVAPIFGPNPIKVEPPPGLSMAAMEFGDVRVSTYQLAVVIGTAVLLIGVERFYRTRTGRAILAIAEDRDAALLRGVRPARLTRWSFLLGGAIAALAGLMAAPLLLASISLGPTLLLKGFAAVAVGGVGNNRGALAAGLVIGLTEAIGGSLLSPGFQPAVVFGVLLLILLIRPQGLFGLSEARAV
jgi:branched-chain amino acid transport system permease protein